MGKIQLDKYIHMGCRTLGEGHEYNWQFQDIKSFKLPQGKSFFVFGGNNTNCAEAANGNAKVVEKLLSESNREKSNIYSFVYDAEPISYKSKCLTESYEEEIHQLFEQMFKPLITDKIGNLKEKQGIEKVFRNLVFVSHCGGSNFVNVLIDDFFETLTTKFHTSVAELLIGKIQYFSYAPNVLPDKKVNALIIAPFYDVDCSWTKILNSVKDKRIDLDYPKSIMKKIFKANPYDVASLIQEEFQNQRLIAFRAEQNIYLIPNRINANEFVGDHSIDCLVKKNVLEADSVYAKTAKLLNYSSRLVLNHFANDYSVNFREICDKVIKEASVEKLKNTEVCDDQKDIEKQID